jgi:opacity protein-like surface antigen|tara:strand:- start:4400 stop:5044 length:645 start_codon:yes stop_codon:yes gene_type:complete
VKKIILLGVLVLLPTYTQATVVSEILIGKAKNKIHTYQDHDLGDSYSSTLNSDSFGFRLGYEFNEYLAFEIAKHRHGESVNEYTISIPAHFPSDYKQSMQVRVPLEVESIRFGIKGKSEIFKDFSINARFGVAHWEYKDANPTKLVPTDNIQYQESGNDLYAAIGLEYLFTEHFYLGVEYSLLGIKESKEYDYSGTIKYQHDIQDFSVVLGWRF